MEYTHVTHTFGPVFDEASRILILGSFPSVKSRENQFYYGHPQNRFWKMLAEITGEKAPGTIEEKKIFLRNNRLALWDVIASCEIEGSSDSSIRNVAANDMDIILRQAPIEKILCNGGKAYELFCRYCNEPCYPPAKKCRPQVPQTPRGGWRGWSRHGRRKLWHKKRNSIIIRSSKMIKILFICLGNICRSPMAEFVMKDLVKKAGLESEFTLPLRAPATRSTAIRSIRAPEISSGNAESQRRERPPCSCRGETMRNTII